jgi:hypothetical protein
MSTGVWRRPSRGVGRYGQFRRAGAVESEIIRFALRTAPLRMKAPVCFKIEARVGAWQGSGDRVGYAFSWNEELPHDQSCELRPARFPEDVQAG